MLEFEIISGIIALAASFVIFTFIKKKSIGSEQMKNISKIIQDGAITFLRKEYEIIAVFMLIASALIYFFVPGGIKTVVSFVAGGIFSALAGYISMRIATSSNSRTAEASKKSVNEGFKVAFGSGASAGLAIVGVGLLGVIAVYIFFRESYILYGYGFGASSIALFARVGGGIYTKAADVGADLVGKVEKGIPEDDPRNPAVIADNVGDNVGDVAGMGADLFESYVNSIIAAIVLGISSGVAAGAESVFPFALAAAGILCSIIGMMLVRTKNSSFFKSLNLGIFASTVLTAIAAFIMTKYYGLNTGVFYSVAAGLICGVLIGLSTEYFTASHGKPVKSIALAAESGAGTNLIQGISVGMMSTLIPILVVSITVILSYNFAGLYGIAISAVGMLSTLGITLAVDIYGPIADNSAGISEMAKLSPEIRKRTEELDAVGNTTAAIGKGFAIGSAALTALALFASFSKISGVSVISITEPKVMAGLLIGGMLPFIFSSLAMQAVGKAAHEIVDEVRRQFKQIKGLMSGKSKPDYNKCIEISTKSALKRMVLPGVIAVSSPIIIGLSMGAEALGGMLAGATVTGFLLAVFMANAGGAWDNAKKYIEEGNLGGKGSDVHKAAVVGDTVGDPFKDTAGPSINILIKLMSIVALIVVPLIV